MMFPFRWKLPVNGLCVIALLSSAVQGAGAAPLLHCHMENGDTVQDIDVAPTADPYSVSAIKINRFRFKPVVVGHGDRVDYVKLYTYFVIDKESDTKGSRGPRLLHEVKYLAPQAQTGTAPASLTGTVYLYEPSLGREFIYDCALREART